MNEDALVPLHSDFDSLKSILAKIRISPVEFEQIQRGMPLKNPFIASGRGTKGPVERRRDRVGRREQQNRPREEQWENSSNGQIRYCSKGRIGYR